MLFRNMELDFDIFDAETADAYEAAAQQARDASVRNPEDTMGDAIRRQCGAVFDFFDELFGDGFHKELFGDRTNLVECVDVYSEFNKAVSAQKARLDAAVADAMGASVTTLPNRAARRASVRK